MLYRELTGDDVISVFFLGRQLFSYGVLESKNLAKPDRQPYNSYSDPFPFRGPDLLLTTPIILKPPASILDLADNST